MLNQEFIKYEQALKLKQLGFNKLCFGWYDGSDPKHVLSQTNMNSEWSEGSIHCAAPLKQQVFRWFREYKVFGLVDCYDDRTFNIEILDSNGNRIMDVEDNDFETFDEAEMFCIDKLIELVENK
jgi:hypothetical protein